MRRVFFFKLRGCQDITLKGLESFSPYNYIRIDLTDTKIKEEDIFIYRRKKPDIKIDFIPIYRDLKKVFEDGLYSDLTFVAEGKEIPAHRFPFLAFDIIPNFILENKQPLKIDIKDISYKDFKVILEEIYTGKLTKESHSKLPQDIFKGRYDAKFIQKLYNNPSLSDFIVEAEGCKFHCHRALLSIMSPFFASALSSNMKESILNEITLPDLDQEECAWILQTLYFLKPTLPKDRSKAQGLYGKIESFISNRLTYTWQIDCEKQFVFDDEEIDQWLNFAKENNLSILKEYCGEIISKNSNFVSLSINEGNNYCITVNSSFLSDPSPPIPEGVLTKIHQIDFEGELKPGEWEKICENYPISES